MSAVLTAEAARSRLVELRGTPVARGLQHGEMLRREIQDFLNEWRDYLRAAGSVDPDAFVSGLVGNTGLAAAARKWAPHLLLRIGAIARAGNISLRDLLAVHFGEEAGWWLQGQPGPTTQCSTVAVFEPGGRTLLAQNLDIPVFTHKYLTLLHIVPAEPEPERYLLTYPGVVGVWGLNQHGVGLCTNSLGALRHSQTGLAASLVAHGALEQTTFAGALSWMQCVPHTSGVNFGVGGSGEVADLECSANKVVRLFPDGGARQLSHTNHPLVSDDLDPGRVAPEAPVAPPSSQNVDSEARLKAIKHHLEIAPRPVTVEAVKHVLRSHASDAHPVCRHPGPDGRWATGACLIMELDKAPVLHLALGQPCSAAFHEYQF